MRYTFGYLTWATICVIFIFTGICTIREQGPPDSMLLSGLTLFGAALAISFKYGMRAFMLAGHALPFKMALRVIRQYAHERLSTLAKIVMRSHPSTRYEVARRLRRSF